MNSLSEKFVFKIPIGNLKVVEKAGKISQITFTQDEEDEKDEKAILSETLRKAVGQLREYFQGKRKAFDFEMKIDGSDFERKVFDATKNVPFASVKTYSEIAEIIGRPKAYRAVANALGKNKLVIAVPCHRVIAKNGVGGFSSGLWRKKWLLKHEKDVNQQKRQKEEEVK